MGKGIRKLSKKSKQGFREGLTKVEFFKTAKPNAIGTTLEKGYELYKELFKDPKKEVKEAQEVKKQADVAEPYKKA